MQDDRVDGTPFPREAMFKVRHQTHKRNRRPATTTRIARAERVMTGVVRELNDQFSLPFEIDVSLEECGEPDAFYDSDTHQIIVCHETIDAYYTLFSRRVRQEAKLNEVVDGTISSLFLHEMGHALVDAWKLPVTGREEDAVDQLSTLVLINGTVDGERMALDGARAFEILAKLEEHETKLFWDEHSQDAQRYYDTICLIYGSDSQKYEYLVYRGTLPGERAEVCREDYQRVKNAWLALLSPYAKGALWSHQEPDQLLVSSLRGASPNQFISTGVINSRKRFRR